VDASLAPCAVDDVKAVAGVGTGPDRVPVLVWLAAVAGDRFEDLVGGFGPHVRAWVLVPGLDPRSDVAVEFGY
jgi:hypothetical protein